MPLFAAGAAMPLTYFLKGAGLGGTLIIAIGAQNAHVLRIGVLKQHVGVTVLICALCDIVLIAAGVAGVGAVIERSPMLLAAARWGGAAFLALYGLKAWRAAFAGAALAAGQAQPAPTTARAALTALALSLLNPHVYLDTVVLLGAVGAQMPREGQHWFAGGAMSASAAWFLSLGFGARLLAPWLARPHAWRVLDGMIGTVMLALAASLALNGSS
jgi:L-lysine exporter family protein LysE/ArgO